MNALKYVWTAISALVPYHLVQYLLCDFKQVTGQFDLCIGPVTKYLFEFKS